jgi:hypothetical protein
MSMVLVSGSKPIYDSSYYSFSSRNFKLNLIERTISKLPSRLAYSMYPVFSGFFQKGFGPWYIEDSVKSALDFGAGDGALVCAINRLYGSRFEFFDPYFDGCNEFNVDRVSLNSKKYDLIVLSHVLEHFEEVNSELCQILPSLRIGGLLVVRVPVRNFFWTVLLGHYWRQLDPPYHRTIPSTKGLICLLESQGCTVEHVLPDGNDLSWRSLASSQLPKGLLYLLKVGQGLLNLFGISDQKTLIFRKSH